jgi:streptogrisin C
MNRIHLTRIGGVALLAAGVALAVALPASAVPTGAERSERPAVSAELRAALQRDLGLTPEEAEVRAQAQQAAAGTERTLRADLGSAYAGAWFDTAKETLVVGVTDAARAADVRAAGAVPAVVEHSAAELDAVKTSLDQRSASTPDAVTGWAVDAASNSVVVTTVGAAADALNWADAGAVRVEHVAEAPRTLWNLIGGQAITTGGSRCSLGFNARSGSTRLVITAGHCTALGGTWSGSGGTIGPVQGGSFPTNDYGAIRVTSSSAVSTALVDRYSAGSDVTVAGSTDVPVGGSVCRSGSTTGWHCGTVQQRNATVCYQQGCVYQTIRTNVCAEPGDSGGSLVSTPASGRVQAQGMTSGGSGNCRSGGTTYFQPVREALSAFSATLVTG